MRCGDVCEYVNGEEYFGMGLIPKENRAGNGTGLWCVPKSGREYQHQLPNGEHMELINKRGGLILVNGSLPRADRCAYLLRLVAACPSLSPEWNDAPPGARQDRDSFGGGDGVKVTR